MLKKMVEPAWGNKLVTEITKSDVAKFLDFVAEGRPRPSKELCDIGLGDLGHQLVAPVGFDHLC